jgi:hypothetical protein
MGSTNGGNTRAGSGTNGRSAALPQAAGFCAALVLAALLTACSSGNPLIGKWSPKGDNSGLIRLGSLEFTPTEEIIWGSDGQIGSRTPVTYQVHGTIVDITGGLIPECEVHGDEMRAQLPLAGTVPYVRSGSVSAADMTAPGAAPAPPAPPKLPPGPDPAVVFLQAVSTNDEPTLVAANPSLQQQVAASYQSNPQSLWPKVRQDAIDQSRQLLEKRPLDYGIDPNLYYHNSSFKVIDTKIGQRDDSGAVSATKFVEFDYASPDDSPLTSKGYLRKATVSIPITATDHPMPDWPVNFTIGRPTLVDAGCDYWPDNGPHIIALTGYTTQEHRGDLMLTTVGGTGPFKLTLLDDGHYAAEFNFDTLPTRQQIPNVPFGDNGHVTLYLTDAKGHGDAVSCDVVRNVQGVAARLFDHGVWQSIFGTYADFGPMPDNSTPLTPVPLADVQKILDATTAARLAQAASIHRVVQDGIFFYEAQAMPGVWSEPVVVPQNPTSGNVRAADPAHIRITVDGVGYDKPAPLAFKGASVLRFMSTSDQPNPFAVRMFVRKLTDAEKKLPPYVMPPWPPETPAGAGYADQPTHDALVALLKKGPAFHGQYAQDRMNAVPVDASLSFDDTTQLVTGWFCDPSVNAKKKWSGRIVDDGTGRTVLLMTETECISIPKIPNIIVGASYWLTPSADGTQLTGRWTNPTPTGVYPASFTGTITLSAGSANPSTTSNP